MVAEVQVPYSPEQQEAAAENTWSSHGRELLGIKLGLQALLASMWRPQLEHGRLLIGCDNQGTVSNALSMRASNQVELQDMFDLWGMLWQHDVQPDFQWLPRDTELVRQADALSKVGPVKQVLISLGQAATSLRVCVSHISHTKRGKQIKKRPRWLVLTCMHDNAGTSP